MSRNKTRVQTAATAPAAGATEETKVTEPVQETSVEGTDTPVVQLAETTGEQPAAKDGAGTDEESLEQKEPTDSQAPAEGTESPQSGGNEAPASTETPAVVQETEQAPQNAPEVAVVAQETPAPTPLETVAQAAQEGAQERWDATAVTTAPEVQVMITTLEAYSQVMGPSHRHELKVGCDQQYNLFRTVQHVIGYLNGEHFVAAMDVLVNHIREQANASFSHRLLFRYLNLKECPLSTTQRAEFADFFTVLTAVATASASDRGIVAKKYDLAKSFRLIKKEQDLQRFNAYFKRLCHLD